MPSVVLGSSFRQKSSYSAIHSVLQAKLVGCGWGLRRHYDCIVCPSVTSQPRVGEEPKTKSAVAYIYTLKHIFKCIGKTVWETFFSIHTTQLSSILLMYECAAAAYVSRQNKHDLCVLKRKMTTCQELILYSYQLFVYCTMAIHGLYYGIMDLN